MAIKPETEFVGKINAADADYPQGSARNITAPNDGLGTPWKARLINDLWGFVQKLLDIAGITPSGSPDTVLASDYFNGLMTVVSRPTLNITTMAALTDVRAGNIIITGERSTGNGGGGIHKAIVTGSTPNVDLPNGTDIIVSTDDSSFSFVLQPGDMFIADQYGQDDAGVKRFLEVVGATGNGMMGPRTYTVTSEIVQAFTFCHIMGVPGKTKITGAFGPSVMQLLASNNMVFEDIIFETTFIDAVDDNGTAIVHSQKVSHIDPVWIRCKFTGPNCGCNGLVYYTRTQPNDTETVDGLRIIDCKFEDLGRIGCVVFNRSTTADKEEAFTNFKFIGNLGKNLGLISPGGFGFLLSLDGVGSDFHVNKNTCENCLGIGIENTGWVNGNQVGNIFKDFSRVWSPMEFTTRPMRGLYVAGNICHLDAQKEILIFDVEDSEFVGNIFRTTTTPGALIRDCNGTTFSGGLFQSSGSIACQVESSAGTSESLIFNGVTFDTSASGSNFSTLRFNGAAAIESRVVSCNFNKGAGGAFFDQINSASKNRVDEPTNVGSGMNFEDQTFTMTDADKTLSIQEYAAKKIRLNGTLTANRNIILPDIEKQYTVQNGTTGGFSLTFKQAAGGGTTVAAGMTAIITSSVNSVLRATADV